MTKQEPTKPSGWELVDTEELDSYGFHRYKTKPKSQPLPQPPFVVPELNQEEQDEIQESWESLEEAQERLEQLTQPPIKGLVGKLYGVKVLPETTEEWLELLEKEIDASYKRGRRDAREIWKKGYDIGRKKVLESMPIKLTEKEIDEVGIHLAPIKLIDNIRKWKIEQLNQTHREG